jgi:hypothetical protein
VTPEDEERTDDSKPWPPGQFMDAEIEADTKRFVEEARELARRRVEERPWEEDDL